MTNLEQDHGDIPMRQRDKTPAWMLGIAAAFTLTAAHAQPPQEAQGTETPAASPAGESQALRAVRDKTTGKLRAPTADEREAMEATERAARQARGVTEPAPLRIQWHANGMRSAVLGADYLITLKGERRADGSVRRFHPQGDHEHSVAQDSRPTE